MKILAVLLMLVAIAAGVNSNLEQEANVLNYNEQDSNKMVESDLMASRQIVWGVDGPDDRLISSTIHSADAFNFLINDQEVTYRGHETTNITRIVVLKRVGDITQVDLVDGGLYHNFVTIRFTCQRSYSMYNIIDIFATINCHNN
ncbi:uncharacterized protein LOC111361941 [Spodoptera litura]|uniref:Uncharacterized protein LOC111361941 n=1 Tax=Spodoptera litura TaxID=69820 RepID=A0A9J7J0E9_SPOLT|nr:uncharacterized protein LOC111361941 [Spodoptera litura]